MKALAKKSLTLVAALGLAAMTVQAAENQTAKPATESAMKAAALEKAPDFSAEDFNGTKYSLSQFKGKVVVLEWTNPDCPFVQRHYREGTFKKLDAEYKDKGMVWLAVNSTSTNDAAKSRQWAETNSLPYPILVDRDGKVGKLFGAKTTPHVFVIDKQGEIVYQGGVDDDPAGDKLSKEFYLKAAIEAALAGKLPERRESKPYGCSVKYAN